jgi:hypothetical protein
VLKFENFNFNSISSCNKRRTADSFASQNEYFNSYIALWAGETCPPQTNAQFTQATWGAFAYVNEPVQSY